MQLRLNAAKAIHLNFTVNAIEVGEVFKFKINETAIQAALIISTTTLLTVILGFIFKDYWIPGWVEKRSKKITGQQLFDFHRSQLFFTTFSFANRLDEIYRTRSHYLWTNTPMSAFYDYKYKSSVYRLCTVLGAIRAYKTSETSMTISKVNREAISKLITKLESSLADGQGIEMSVAKSICQIAKVKTESLNQDLLKNFSVEIDHLVNQYQEAYFVQYIAELDALRKAQFIEDVVKLLRTLNFHGDFDIDQQTELIREVSIKLGLIYRDWQQAIGELMIARTDNLYKVSSFKVFEKMWSLRANSEEKQWLNRAEKIFEGLDLKVDKNQDSRIDQLKHIYVNTYKLLFHLFYMKSQFRLISVDVFSKIKKNLE